MTIREVRPADYDWIATRLDEWWDGRNMVDLLPRLFFEHFRDTSLVFEKHGDVIGFLIGFMSPANSDQAYIRFVGVHPARRGKQVANRLYERFFDSVRARERSVVRCITSPMNHGSIEFHTRMGFVILPGDTEVDRVVITHRP